VIQSNVALMTATALDQGDVQAFTISTAQATMSQLLWQADPGNWQVTAVEVPTSGQVEEYISYSTDVQILDASGAPVPKATVQVRATSQTQITVNGGFYTVDPSTPATLTASAAGTLSITQQTDALVIPTELKDAKRADGKFLLPDKYRNDKATTDAVASACNQAMAIAAMAPRPRSDAAMCARRGPKPGVGAIPRGSLADLHRIAVDPGRDGPHWQIEFSTGQARFRTLTADEARALVIEKLASPLTLLDLMCLILAIPATVLFKAMNDAAPFPDDASVAAFEASFSAQTMLSNSGLGASQATALSSTRRAPTPRATRSSWPAPR